MGGLSDVAADVGPLGDYEVLMRIGTGGMGKVYLARKSIAGDTHREFAIKVIHSELDGGESQVATLIEEAKVAAGIRHPNIVPVLDVDVCPRGVFLVMDYIEGDTLAALLARARRKGEPVPLPILARVFHDALAGLHAAHEHRDASGNALHIVHRDFSPQNLLVGVDGIIRLTDFGIAKSVGRGDITKTGVVKGKLAYMSPEQAMGEALDRRTDVWAAGVVMWEAIAGERLFAAASDVAIAMRIVSSPKIPSLTEKRADVPQEVDEAIASALRSDPDERCSSASELRARLMHAWRAGVGIADSDETAQWVKDLAGADLSQRNRDVSAILAARRAGREHRLDTSIAPEPGNDTATANVYDAKESRPPRRTLAVIAITALATAGALWLGARHASSDSTSTTEPSSVPATSAAEQSPRPTPRPTSSSKPSALTVRADAPIREISIDDRPILPSRASERLDVQLSEAERARSTLELRAVATDGRTVVVRVHPGDGNVSLVFGKQRPPGPVPRQDDELAPLPKRP